MLYLTEGSLVLSAWFIAVLGFKEEDARWIPCGDQCRNSLRHQCNTREPDKGVVGDGDTAHACAG